MKRSTLTLISLIFGLLVLNLAQANPLVPPLTVKWSQGPDMDQGIDYLSMHRELAANGGPVVADDFQSNGAHIVGFRWWGSYFQDDPNLPPPPDRTVQFEISFHPDCPAGADCDHNGVSGDYLY